MTNRSGSKQHGMTRANETRPKSKAYKRRNKAKARARREAAALEKLKAKKA